MAGAQSYLIDSDFRVSDYLSYNQFLEVNGRLFGTSDKNGLVYISMKDKKHVPCERMVGYKNGVLGTSWKAVTYFTYDEQERISWKGARVTAFEKGDTMASLICKDHLVVGGG